ncbi:HlyD family secretion protein [Poritiphilus flavus]|uniref:HlyD family efflux transporter periplasmic adaptor subunit n=1 Tax=Poritiphilus flavus TaxID=2697053 RepID=A0A6L9EFE2_9FLAO|nr:HlyD family efflux transporter periplasmic adaptor subunit [Poritiphilus flavus]NAS12999.1 HlyD family efflux transporter periplasmic adaptor subunit [Poritiphilus flavus]
MSTAKKKKIDYLNESSDQVKEILGRAPNWMIRWGITVVFLIVFLLIAMSAIIRYDDIILARINITTRIPPAYIRANSSGKLTGLYAETGDPVAEGEIIGEIENTADLSDVYWLKNKLSSFNPILIELDSLQIEFPSDLKLGDIRQTYSDFISQYQSYILFNTLEPSGNEIKNTSIQIRRQYELLDKQRKQLEFFSQELDFSESEYQRNKTLMEKGVISKSEFETIARKYLADKQHLESLKSIVASTRIEIAALSGSKIRHTISDKELTYANKQELIAQLELLKNEIFNWELKYVLKSPMDGKLTMFDIRNKYQNVKSGEIVFTIVPAKIDSLIGHVTMPVQNSGKVKVGQEVIIKLDNYPYHEWGSLRGKIIDISAVPKKGEAIYSIFLVIENLNTSFNKNLEFKQEMQGNAEIITEELSVLERIFYQLTSIFTRN